MLNHYLDLIPNSSMTFDNQSVISQTTDIGFYSSSPCSSPESAVGRCPTVSPTHSNTESVDSAFDDILDGSFYDGCQPADSLLKSVTNTCPSVLENFQTDVDIDWMSMPLDFGFAEEDTAGSEGQGRPPLMTEAYHYTESQQKVKRESSPDIDFHNLEIVLKEKAKERMHEEQIMKCTQEEMKLLQNVMLYKQQMQRGVMFQEALQLPSALHSQLDQQTQQQQQQHHSYSEQQQDPPAYTQIACPTNDTLEDSLPDEFLAKNCASLIDFINNPNARFPDNIPLTPNRGIAMQYPSQVLSNQTLTKTPKSRVNQRNDSSTASKPRALPTMPKSTSKPRLYNFLVELLKNPDKFSCIEWINQEEGIFKFLDSAEVARLWGHRKNKPNMKYENFARSLRTYIAKGILTKPRNKLVYKFVKSVV